MYTYVCVRMYVYFAHAKNVIAIYIWWMPLESKSYSCFLLPLLLFLPYLLFFSSIVMWKKEEEEKTGKGAAN